LEFRSLNSYRHLCSALGVDVAPEDVVDAIVSRPLEEAGQHILRVEVGYLASEGMNKTLRKFYRFNVSNPLNIRELTVRSGDDSCFVSIAVENVSQHAMTISSVTFETPAGLVSERIGETSPIKTTERKRAVQLYDSCGRLEPKAAYRYMFRVTTASQDAALKGIACGDELGKAVLEWKKTMGEAGRMASSPVRCPIVQPPGLRDKNSARFMMGTGNRFVVHGSGLSVDVAATAANRAAGKAKSDLDQILPVTVETIDPPQTMRLAEPEAVQFLVVNHSSKPMKLQFQFRLNQMSGVAVCGTSFKNLGEIAPNGGSTVVEAKLIALVAGLLRVQGCCILDQSTGQEIPQPPLFNVYVESTMAKAQ
jgi:hypothetical protein